LLEFARAKFRHENLKHAFPKWAQEVASSSKRGGGIKSKRKLQKKKNGIPNFKQMNQGLKDDPKRKYNTHD
jgi:hypothetical protein